MQSFLAITRAKLRQVTPSQGNLMEKNKEKERGKVVARSRNNLRLRENRTQKIATLNLQASQGIGGRTEEESKNEYHQLGAETLPKEMREITREARGGTQGETSKKFRHVSLPGETTERKKQEGRKDFHEGGKF